MSTNPHRTYRYVVPGGETKTVEADRVDFTANHVVFLDTRTLYPTIVLAEQASDVRRLTDVTDLPPAEAERRYKGDRRLS